MQKLSILFHGASGLLIGLLLIMITGLQLSCKRLVEVPPPVTSTNEENVYASDATAIAVLNGVYASMTTGANGSTTYLSWLASLSADELSLIPNTLYTQYILYYTNNLNPGVTGAGFEAFSASYRNIYTVNAVIAGLNSKASLTMTPAVKQQLMGEAQFIRAFNYFYLVNLYGDVPLTLTTDRIVNASLARTSRDLVWKQVIADLKDANSLLRQDYPDGTLLNTGTERTRPNAWAAAALLARAYLYTGVNDSAEIEATAVINRSDLYGLSSLDTAFLKNNSEAIWQIQPVNYGINTPEAQQFILPVSGPDNEFHAMVISPFLLNDFEGGDRRRVKWIDSVIANGITYYYPYKYKSNLYGAPVTEYSTLLRLAEQYLIRAEARARQNNVTGAQQDLNAVRARAGLAPTGAGDQASLLQAIAHERRVELFAEWGHRWLDLKRTGEVDSVMQVITPQKGGSWSSYKQYYPVGVLDIATDPQLKQTPGY